MVNWSVVAAFCSPLIAAIALVGAWFTWIGHRRDAKVAQQIKDGTAEIVQTTAQLTMRMAVVENGLATQGAHLSKQDETLQTLMQSMARIEGRLAGPFQITTTTSPKEG